MSNPQIQSEGTTTRVDQTTNITVRKVTKRDLPAYLDYAADHLANLNYRLTVLYFLLRINCKLRYFSQSLSGAGIKKIEALNPLV